MFHWRYILVSQNLRSTLAMARVQRLGEDAVFLSRWQNLNEKTVDMKIEGKRKNVKCDITKNCILIFYLCSYLFLYIATTIPERMKGIMLKYSMENKTRLVSLKYSFICI